MYARHPDVTIRREYFGGIAFHSGAGATIELDREACLFLERADGSSIRAVADGICEEGCMSVQDIYAVADTLLREGFLVKDGVFDVFVSDTGFFKAEVNSIGRKA